MPEARSPLPLRITLVLWLVLSTSAWNLVRVWGGLALRVGIQEYAPWPGSTYVILTGTVWALCGIVLAAAFWRREYWADKALLGAAIAYVAWLWLDRLIIQRGLPANWPFALLTNGVCLIFVAAVAVDPRNHLYLRREAHEREEQGRKTR